MLAQTVLIHFFTQQEPGMIILVETVFGLKGFGKLLIDSNGKIVAGIEVVRDITKRKLVNYY